jgi:DNA primase catalytic subunit
VLENENDLQSDLRIWYVSDEYCRRGDKERAWRMEYLDGKSGERARVERRPECQLKENPM